MERTNCMGSVIIHWIVDSYQWYDLLDSQFKVIFSNLCLLVLNWWRIHQDLPSNGLVLSTPTYFLGSKARDCKMNWFLYDLMKCILINNNGDKSMLLDYWILQGLVLTSTIFSHILRCMASVLALIEINGDDPHIVQHHSLRYGNQMIPQHLPHQLNSFISEGFHKKG